MKEYRSRLAKLGWAGLGWAGLDGVGFKRHEKWAERVIQGGEEGDKSSSGLGSLVPDVWKVKVDTYSRSI